MYLKLAESKEEGPKYSELQSRFDQYLIQYNEIEPESNDDDD